MVTAIQNDAPAARIALLTPYLAETLDDSGKSDEWKKEQVERYKFNPNNFAGLTHMRTANGRWVRLETHANHTLPSPALADLIIIGSTREQEELVQKARITGAIAARYSIFYGNKSGYTGLFPEEAGYSLDIPKDVETARALMTSDEVLDSLVSRELSRIQDAVEGLNETLREPILITPYLATALKHPRPKI